MKVLWFLVCVLGGVLLGAIWADWAFDSPPAAPSEVIESERVSLPEMEPIASAPGGVIYAIETHTPSDHRAGFCYAFVQNGITQSLSCITR